MYFECQTLKALMRVTACEKARASKVQTCKSCTNWQEFTAEGNLKTAAEVETPWVEKGIEEEPVRFDHRADINRMHSIGKGRKYHGKR